MATAAAATPKSGIVKRALALVERVQGAGQHKVDASHDSFHVLRVLATARRLVRTPLPPPALSAHDHTLMRVVQAEEERKRGVQVDETVVDLAAILHDVDDYKYRAPTDDASLSHARVRSRDGQRTIR
jgi:HD superfamily phosphodiesterase